MKKQTGWETYKRESEIIRAQREFRDIWVTRTVGQLAVHSRWFEAGQIFVSLVEIVNDNSYYSIII